MNKGKLWEMMMSGNLSFTTHDHHSFPLSMSSCDGCVLYDWKLRKNDDDLKRSCCEWSGNGVCWCWWNERYDWVCCVFHSIPFNEIWFEDCGNDGWMMGMCFHQSNVWIQSSSCCCWWKEECGMIWGIDWERMLLIRVGVERTTQQTTMNKTNQTTNLINNMEMTFNHWTNIINITKAWKKWIKFPQFSIPPSPKKVLHWNSILWLESKCLWAVVNNDGMSKITIQYTQVLDVVPRVWHTWFSD